MRVQGLRPVFALLQVSIPINITSMCGVLLTNVTPAGNTLSVEMHQQPNDRSCRNQALGGNHFGPVMVYMSKVADAKTDAGAGEWFKVAEDTYAGTDASWGTVSTLLRG